ncbi:golgin subfamily A member 4-like [Tribolium madens]|uniref:golgin subfamily A member 4-like n=1 Tax=Tribolium madens TaxID=41895 RepID=UPI001CF72A54|nr:golgin subfamily A member 4-like [Tribolium madens]
MDNIIECIYKSCDENNKNLVSVSSLIDFINPYMPNNLSELNELKSQLDPDSVNPHIGYSFFESVMSDWIKKMQGDNINSGLSELHCSLSQNFSLSQNESIKSNNNNTCNVNLEEQIWDLKYQLNKAVSELDLVKQQLAASEEQNEGLIADLKSLHKMQQREQHVSEQSCADTSDNYEKDEEVNAAMKEREQLQKLRANYEKQQKLYLAQINVLESENQVLKQKLTTCEKVNKKNKTTMIDLQDDLELKDAEITTLREVIDNLNSQLEEKVELVNFYTKEQNLAKQRIHNLEDLIRNNTPRSNKPVLLENDLKRSSKSTFNSPKLLNQLAHPVTPRLSNSPINLKDCASSSPINSSMESTNCSIYDISNIGVVTLRSPRKSLQQELAEINSEKVDEGEEVTRLYKLVKDQEEIKNNLWQNMKELCCENEVLRDNKKELTNLINALNEKDEIIKNLKVELDNITQKAAKADYNNLIQVVAAELSKVDTNLREQLSIDDEIQENLAVLSNQLHWEVSDKLKNAFETIKTLKLKLRKEQILNSNLRAKLCQKSTVDKATATFSEECMWHVPIVSESTDPKKTNFAKQQMRLERMLEKQEKTEKELVREKCINTKLMSKYEKMCTEKEILANDLVLCREKICNQTKTIEELIASKKALFDSLGVMETGAEILQTENNQLRDETLSLAKENHNLNENLRDYMNKLLVEATMTSNLRTEISFLVEKNQDLEKNITGRIAKEGKLKNQIINTRMTCDLAIAKLCDELSEKTNEIRNLRKQIEDMNIDAFLSTSNRELRCAILDIFDHFNCDRGVLEEEEGVTNAEFVLDIEKEMVLLNNNIKLIKSLSELNQNQSTEQSEDSDEAFDKLQEISMNQELLEDTFLSCTSQISHSEQDMFEAILPLQYDSFLDNLELEEVDLKQLSHKEIEEKFASLALTLTVDVATSKKRCLNEEEKFNQLILSFFTYLNCSMDIMKKLSSSKNKRSHKTVLNYLQQVKETGEKLVKCAVECGVLHYEKRMANCWKLVINYVAILTQENKQSKESCGRTNENLETESPLELDNKKEDVNEILNVNENVLIVPQLRQSSPTRTKCYICLFFFVFIIVVFALFYIDQLCPKDGKRICPIEWLTNLFIEKKYYDDHL